MKKFLLILVSLVLLVSLCSCAEVIDGILCDLLGVTNSHEHSFGEWETKTSATCESAEVEVRKCECGEEETREGDAALGHSFGEWETKTAATCTEAGVEVRACACGKEETNNIPATGHSFGEWETKTAADCENAEVEVRKCACGEEETREGDTALGHSFGEWETKTAADCENAEVEVRKCACGEEETREGDSATGHTAVSISAVLNKTDAMKYDVLTAQDFVVTAACNCGATYTVTEGIALENATLEVEGENIVTVKLGDLSSTVSVNAAKFNKVVNGTIVDDTHVNSGSNSSSYSERTELYIYNTGAYRVFFRFNFSDVLNSQYYADFGEEAIVKFTFTITNGVDVTGLPVTFKSYLTSDVRSSADFSVLTWSNYSKTYTLGWGTEEDPNNTVSLLAKEPVGNRATYADGKLVITVTMRELEGCIDANGNAIFVLLTAQKDVKPYIASMENEEFDIPAVEVIFSDDHAHAYIENVVDDKYLASAECEKKATYYKSCSCGEAGTATFEHGEVIEHVFSEWATKSAADCLNAEVEFRTCHCGKEETQTGDVALGHDMQTKYDITNHWTECSRCDEATEAVAHFGGTATETEQAICEGCGQPYGGLATHEHYFGEWESFSPATCDKDEVLIRYCNCGVSETTKGTGAFGHDVQTKYDETNHWTECVHNCGLSTEPVAHFGGEATETEQAICEGCNQPYGELKPAEKKEYTISGVIVEDTYVASDSGTAKKSDYSTSKTALGIGSKYYRSYFKFNISNIINSEDFDATNTDAKIQFIFTLSKGALDESTAYTFGLFTPGSGVSDVAFSNVIWNNLSPSSGTALYPDLKWDKANNLLDAKVNPDNVMLDGNTITMTFNYSEIANYVASDGTIVVTFRTSTTGVSIASMENTEYAIPAIKYVYEK